MYIETREGGQWWSGKQVCRLCGHEQVAMVPVEDIDDDVLTRCECDNCGNMTCEPIDGLDLDPCCICGGNTKDGTVVSGSDLPANSGFTADAKVRVCGSCLFAPERTESSPKQP